MGRPRKSEEADARQRIQNAFWELLEERQLREITVGIITARAACNRGTFYYHYHDIDDLIGNAIEDDLIRNGALAENIFHLSIGGQLADLSRIRTSELHHISLLLNRGGMDMVLEKMHAVVRKMWQSVLCPNGEALTDAATAIIEFTVGGVLALLVMNDGVVGLGNAMTPSALKFTSDNARFIITRLAEAQGIPQETVIMRLSPLNHYLATTRSA